MRAAYFSALLLLANLATVSVAHAAISVGAFAAEKSCTIYELQWGREFSAAASGSTARGASATDGVNAAGAYASSDTSTAVYAREWGTQLRRECVQNFPTLQSTVASAMASVGPVVSDARAMTLSGHLTGVGYDAQVVNTRGSSITDQFMVVSIEFQLKDKRGTVVFGGALTKRVRIGMGTEAAGIGYGSAEGGQATFAQMQQQVGFAIARAVIFHLSPLRVTANDGNAIALNYGAPLIPLGGSVTVVGTDGVRSRRLTVISSMAGRSVIESDAHIPLSDIAVGSIATFAEADDPAANTRLIDRVALPEN